MRLVRYLFVLIVVLSTSAWAASTQAELPGSWIQAALLTQPAAAERDVRVVVGACDLAARGVAAGTCASVSARSAPGGCGPALACQQWAGRGAGGDRSVGIGMPGVPATRGHITVAFSNLSDRDDRAHLSKPECGAGLAEPPAGLQARPRDCVG
ncbi:hypothetical protein LL972_11330 [Xanthomonas campestris pv. asclepiadis]|uniref:hypothetical protein n=1 Tax=Xanthomonas campestris TaxID=339 RepID=UPI001E42813D|nr:hypothetical protein [Xanthomonas campestris]MCC4616585.1 hypothetical protein [Xanthomonas campestris pv. asclepiadis]